MVLAFALSEMLAPLAPAVADFLWIFAATTAALNFLNLLPFWPLDGGRCLRAVIHALNPRAALAASVVMSAAFAAAAVAVGSVLLFLVALVGVATIRTGGETRPGMTPGEAGLALGAYAFTTAAHFAGGALLLRVYL
jgi:Zn-dependent protease